jgi:hypothetical protein
MSICNSKQDRQSVPMNVPLLEETLPSNKATAATASHLDSVTMIGNSILSLPNFSAKIQSLLDSGKIFCEWDSFIEETAFHLLSQTNINSKSEYLEYGRMMHSKYPCISHEGQQHPWVCF